VVRRGHVCLLSNRKSEGRGNHDHERAAIHHAKILRLFGRHVERREQAFREGASVAVVDADEASFITGAALPIDRGTTA